MEAPISLTPNHITPNAPNPETRSTTNGKTEPRLGCRSRQEPKPPAPWIAIDASRRVPKSALVALATLTLILTSIPMRAEDPRPVAFFIHPDGVCPGGWEEATYARGRLILPVHPEYVGKTWGDPFRPAQNPTHTHEYTITWHQDFVRRNWNSSLTGNAAVFPAFPSQDLSSWVDPHQSGGTTTPSELGLPFFQAVLCEQQADDGLIDVLPKDSVLLFNGNSCPVREPGLEWVPYESGMGRFIVPLVERGQHEAIVGNPPWHGYFFSVLNLMHYHDYSKDVAKDLTLTPEMSTDPYMKPTWYEYEHNLWYLDNLWVDGTESTVTLKTSKGTATSGAFPFYTLLACRKQGPLSAAEPKPSLYFTFFRATGDCASYYRVPATMGRFLVALPEDALPNQAFGDPLKDRETRVHHHGPVAYPGGDLPYRLARAGGSGPKQGGVCANGHYSWQVEPNPANPEIPYIQLAHCWPKSPEASLGDGLAQSTIVTRRDGSRGTAQ